MCGSKGWPVAKITNYEEFENWLEVSPAEWVSVIDARTALRILPLMSSMFEVQKLSLSPKRDFMFSVYRAAAILWVTRNYPTHDLVKEISSHAAYKNVRRAADATSFPALVIPNATIVYARAAAATNAALLSSSYAVARAASDSLIAAITTDRNASHAILDNNSELDAEIWVSIDADAEFLIGADGDTKAAAKRLAGKGLWFNRGGAISTPEWCLNALDKLEHHLLKLDDNWHVWTQWYRPLLQGQSGWGLSAKNAEDLIVRITTQDEKSWDRGASKINAEIARWLEEIGIVETVLQDELVTVSTEFISKTDNERTDYVPNPTVALKKARVNHDHLVLISAMLRMEIDEFKEKLRGDNELDPGLRDKLTALLDNHAEAVEAMIAIAEELPENISDDDVNKFKLWFDAYLESVKNELPKYTDPKKFGKATIPAIIVGLSASVGLMFGMPAIFGAGALTMMGFNPAAKTIKEILKKDGGEK